MADKSIKLLILIVALMCWTIAFAGPPVPKGLEGDTLETPSTQPGEDSAKTPLPPGQKESPADKIKRIDVELDIKEKALKVTTRTSKEIESLKNTLENIDTAKLKSFSEIIIDDSGNIKVMTDSGLEYISKSMIDSILPPLPEDYTDGQGREFSSWGKNVVIEEGMRIDKDVQVFSGNATVKGSVNGDVLTVGGDIYVGSTGYVRGNVIAIGGKVKKEEGAKVTGSTLQIRVPLLSAARGSVYQIIQRIIIFAVFFGLILSALSIALFPKPISLISEQLRAHPVKSFFAGYGSFAGIFIIGILLIVSIIGIPLAFLGQPVAVLLLCILAYTAINLAVGQRFFRNHSLIQAYLFGSMITTIIPLGLLLIGYIAGSLPLFVINMIMLGLFMFLFLPFGMGAALLAKFGMPPKPKPEEQPTEQTP